MAVMPYSIANCVDHSRSDLVKQLVMVDYYTSLRHAPVLYLIPMGFVNLTVRGLRVHIHNVKDGYGLLIKY
jgi:hypothetical protein